MKFGVREICDVTFKALQAGKLGNMDVVKGQPVLYIDSAKTSTIEGAATTVYATGGKGNSRLMAWEGERTLTFTVEDALLSPIGFAVLSGAGVFDADAAKGQIAYVHNTAIAELDIETKTATIVLEGDETLADNAPLFIMGYKEGSMTGLLKGSASSTKNKESGDSTKILSTTITITLTSDIPKDVTQVFVDFYLQKSASVTELQISAEKFGGYYYVEGSTLFRRESDGKDLPAEIVFPKVKIQSNFTFTMSSTGDPSTFTFTMDAMPAYTMFNKSKKALCAIQVIDDSISENTEQPVTLAKNSITIEEEIDANDSNGKTSVGE